MATIQIRRNTAAGAAASNPVLAQGEPGIETDTMLLKIGDGVTAWNDLPEEAVYVPLAQVRALIAAATAVIDGGAP